MRTGAAVCACAEMFITKKNPVFLSGIFCLMSCQDSGNRRPVFVTCVRAPLRKFWVMYGKPDWIVFSQIESIDVRAKFFKIKKNRQKISILSRLNLHFIFALFSEMGLNFFCDV